MFCVYRHIRLDKNTPFYVGKGSELRAYDFRNRSKYHKRIVNKHGCEVEVIFQTLDESLAFAKETEFIKMYKALGYCETNFTDGGEGNSGYNYTDEQRLAHSIRNRGPKNPAFGKGYRQLGENNPMFGKVPYSKGKKNPRWSEWLRANNHLVERKHTDFSGSKNPRAKKVIDLNTGIIYGSLKDAVTSLNLGRYHTVKAQLNGTNSNRTSLRYIKSEN